MDADAGACRYAGLRNRKRRLEGEVKAVNVELEKLEEEFADLMERTGLTQFKSGKGPLVYQEDKPQVFASFKVEDQETVFGWLVKLGHEGAIKNTVHHGTFKAMIRDMLEEGVKIPDCVSVTLKPKIVVRSNGYNEEA
jgi:hypothetical protein